MEDFVRPKGWRKKFGLAFRGAKRGIRGQSSFFVHFFVAAAVLAAAAVLDVSTERWCLLLLCITLVLTAEMFNSALEWLARAVDSKHNPHLGEALDISSAAVLLASLGAAIVGAAVFYEKIREMLL